MSASVLNIDLGADHRAFHYRKGSLDEVAIVQELKVSSYNFSRLRRGNELSDYYERLSASGKTPLIIDAGANIGASTIYFHFSFPKARVVATEPDRTNFELLSSNVHDTSVDCLNAVLAGDKSDPPEANQPSCITPTELLDRFGTGTVPFIMKIDVEIAEEDLFAANTKWVMRVPVIIVALRDILIPGSDKVRRFVNCISNFNRDFVYTWDNVFSIQRELR